MCGTDFKRVATVRLAIYHLHDLLVDRLARLVPITPVVAGPYAVLANEEVFWVVDILVWPRLNSVDDPWL